MHADTGKTNPYASPRHVSAAAAGTARGWSYHCPDCDAVCLSYGRTIRRGILGPFRCPECQTKLQFQRDSHRAVRGCISYCVIIAAVLSWLWSVGVSAGIDLVIPLSITLSGAAFILYEMFRISFECGSILKIADPESPDDHLRQP